MVNEKLTTFPSPTTDLLWRWASHRSRWTTGSLLNADSVTFTPITATAEVMFTKYCEILVCVAEVWYFFANKSTLKLDTAIEMEETG